jgi:hypothetical protein
MNFVKINLLAANLVLLKFLPGEHPSRGGGSRAAAPLQIQNLRNTDFVYTIIYKVLHDLPFSRNQPLKSPDD